MFDSVIQCYHTGHLGSFQLFSVRFRMALRIIPFIVTRYLINIKASYQAHIVVQ